MGGPVTTLTQAPKSARVDGDDPQVGPSGRSAAGRRRPDKWGLLVLPLVVFLLLVFVTPLAVILARSVTDPDLGFGNYVDFFGSSVYFDVLVNTFEISGLVTLLTLLLGFPYAYLMTLASPFWRAVLLVAVLVPFWTSLLVRTFAWKLLLDNTGIVNTFLLDQGLVDQPLALIRNQTGVLIGMVQVMLPYAVLPLYAAMRGIDRRLVHAAEGLGARPIVAFWRVYAPLTLPGVAAATLLVFISSIGFYVTPALLGGPKSMMIGELIVQQLSGVLNWGFASALAVVLLVVTSLLLLVVSRFVRVGRLIGGQE